MQKGPFGYFLSKSLFFYFLNVHYLKISSENFSRIAVKINILWSPKHGVHAAALFSAIMTWGCLRNDTQIFNSIMLYINIIYMAQ